MKERKIMMGCLGCSGALCRRDIWGGRGGVESPCQCPREEPNEQHDQPVMHAADMCMTYTYHESAVQCSPNDNTKSSHNDQRSPAWAGTAPQDSLELERARLLALPTGGPIRREM